MVNDTKKVPFIGESKTFSIDHSTLLGILWQINEKETFDN